MPQPIQPFDILKLMWPILWPALKIFGPLFGLELALIVLIRILDPESIRYFFRRNKVELLTTFFAIVGYGVSYYFIEQPQHSFLLNVAISFVAMFVLIYSKTRERDFYFISLNREKDKNEWIGEGKFQYERTQRAYSITNSHSGFIFPKCLLWSDYRVDFDFKILKTSLGVILRATNLSNMVMLQILDTGIRPHIRINGFWQIWEPQDVQFEFSKHLNRDNWYGCTMQCDKNSIRIRVFERIERHSENSSEPSIDYNVIFDRTWKIPSGTIVYGGKDTSLVGSIVRSTVPFPINLEYGTFGFRNDAEENALVKNVLIEKI